MKTLFKAGAIGIASLCLLLSGLATFGEENNTSSSSQNTESKQPDNSGVNARDRDSNAVTAGDQSNSEADRQITQNIRKAIVGEKSLSTVAKNVKIITIDGNVTLRGPVNTDQEKKQIGDLAAKNAPSAKIDNQLEVKSTSLTKQQ
jgi:hyperosmotically inducible protein